MVFNILRFRNQESGPKVFNSMKGKFDTEEIFVMRKPVDLRTGKNFCFKLLLQDISTDS